MDYKTAQLERARIRRGKGLGCRKKRSAKAQNKSKAASHTGICLVCGQPRMICICSGHMSEEAHKRFVEEQKKRPAPKQSGFG